MIKILMTGSTGFVGHNVLPILQRNPNYQILTPSRAELNLKNESELKRYLRKEQFDVVIHFANPTPGKNKLDSFDTLMEDSLRIFMNFYNNRELFGKMIYTGSGAEYDKSQDIDMIDEKDCYRSVPLDAYGLAKQIMNMLAENSSNVYNFRIFGCYGPNDHESKFITHCIRSVILGIPITIRKDCEFDYMHVFDFAKYIDWAIEAELKYHSYNVSTGVPVRLSEIAGMVIDQMESNLGIEILSDEVNKKYTGDNTRIMNESNIRLEYPIDRGIAAQIKWELDNWTEDTKFDGK